MSTGGPLVTVTVDDLMRAARGIPAHHALAELERFTPGICWIRCPKRDSFREALQGFSTTRKGQLTQERARAYLERIERLRAVAAELPKHYRGGGDWCEARRELRLRDLEAQCQRLDGGAS